VVDAATNKRAEDVAKLGARSESFQLSPSGPNVYVNLLDLKQIAVVNRDTHSITRWPLTFESNFPMALDEPDHRLFVATRRPAFRGKTTTRRNPIPFPLLEEKPVTSAIAVTHTSVA
jgi:hypothetical protein